MSQGDPQGIGPDLLLRAASRGLFDEGDQIIACSELLRGRAELIGAPWAMRAFENLAPFLTPLGETGVSQFRALQRAVDLALEAQGEAALLTAPIDKARAQEEGLPTPGHTEYLGLRTGAEEVAMLMAGPRLRVSLATVHIALSQVPQALDAQVIARRTALLIEALRSLYGIQGPKVALLGLNPHAGESGRFGREEIELLGPLVERLAQEHAGRAEIAGPLPADTAFFLHAQGEIDGLIAMYHDQGLAPFKLMHFNDGVNVTLGLPFLRTSPDHGTAKELVGSDRVDPRSFFSALTLARGDRAQVEAWTRGQ